MSTVPSTKMQGRTALRLHLEDILPKPIPATEYEYEALRDRIKTTPWNPAKKRRRFKGWLRPKPKATDALLASLGHKDQDRYLAACTELAQMGLSARDVETIVHAMTNRRILAFSAGTIEDIGEAGRPYDGHTSGSNTYETDTKGRSL